MSTITVAEADRPKEDTKPTDHSQEIVPILTGVTRARYLDLVDVRTYLTDVLGTADESEQNAYIFEFGMSLLHSACNRGTTAFIPAEMAPRIGIVVSPKGRIEESSTLLVDFALLSEDEKHDKLVAAIGMAQTTGQFPVTVFTLYQSGATAYCNIMNHRSAGPGDGKSAFGDWYIEPSNRAPRDESESPVPLSYLG